MCIIKKTTKCHKPGDLKEIIYKRSNTNLCKCLTFLTKFPVDETYIRNKTFNLDKHEQIYQNVITYIDKFG